MTGTATSETIAERGHVARAVEVVLDRSPSQQRWLRSYVGSMRAAYNWALADVGDNLDVRRDERAPRGSRGRADARLVLVARGACGPLACPA